MGEQEACQQRQCVSSTLLTQGFPSLFLALLRWLQWFQYSVEYGGEQMWRKQMLLVFTFKCDDATWRFS